MKILRLTTHRNEYVGIALTIQVIVGITFLAAFARRQSQGSADLALLQGVVRDSNGRPVPAASVSLQVRGGREISSVVSDSAGCYRFSGLHPGVFKLSAERAGYGEATLDDVTLRERESKSVDLILRPPGSSRTGETASGAPQFYDQPSFTIAGVTDPSNLGGHGSDTIVRSKDSLAKAAASLGGDGAGNVRTEPSGSPAEKALRDVADREPESFDLNYRAGKALLDAGKAQDGLRYLERATQLDPTNYDSAHELAFAFAAVGQYENARSQTRALLAHNDKAELHHLMADVEEKAGNSLAAAHEYQRAVELNPSEPYVFDWGAELLLHRAPGPASEVFAKGNRLFPRSMRMLLGLGAAEYSQGLYEQAEQHLCAASDLNPDDPIPYQFMNKIQVAQSSVAATIGDRLEGFARSHPENAEANYFYALNLWKQRKNADDPATSHIEGLLQKAINLDPRFAVAWLQLGTVHAERGDFRHAISEYQEAINVDPRLEDAHYRLAQVYRQTGDIIKARDEIRAYKHVARENAAVADRERLEIKQFVYTLRDRSKPQPR